MAAKDLGNKFVCFKCGTKFYDMKKPEPVCPKCGADQREAAASKPAETRRGRFAAVPKVVEPVETPEPAAAASDDEEAEEFDDDEEPAAAADDDEG
ncbi:MAG: FYDLN acid domain-containing protein [Myxococcaceae bacterium]